MQITYTPGGDVVAVMKGKEVAVAEVALMRYVAGNPDSDLAVRMLRDVVVANEHAEQCAEEAAQAAAANPA